MTRLLDAADPFDPRQAGLFCPQEWGFWDNLGEDSVRLSTGG